MHGGKCQRNALLGSHLHTTSCKQTTDAAAMHSLWTKMTLLSQVPIKVKIYRE